ncbi:MAG: alpha/beta hydrolase [Hungatella sp.]|nr:alpha/beta hydrolase [Hungatella sp.]
MPGFGSSKGNPSIKNADDMLAFLINFIKEVIKDESFLLVGQSYGGYLSLG